MDDISWIWLTVGFIIGALFGSIVAFFALSLVVAARRADDLEAKLRGTADYPPSHVRIIEDPEDREQGSSR